MKDNFYKTWNGRDLEDWGSITSTEYKGWQRALKMKIGKIAKEAGATMVGYTHGHYFESYFLMRNGKCVYINRKHLDRTHIDLDNGSCFLIRTARDEKDYTGGCNQYCNYEFLKDYIEKLLS